MMLLIMSVTMYQHQGDKLKEDEQVGTRSTHGEMETSSQTILRVLTTLSIGIVAEDNIKTDKRNMSSIKQSQDMEP